MGRTIIVGDVHGCSRELSQLLERLRPEASDTLVFVGDLVNRGPDSTGVLRIVRELGARATIGNHEQRLLAARASRAEGKAGPRLGSSLERLMSELSDEDWKQVEAMPLKIDLPEQGLRVVHGGVVPGVPFEELDPNIVTRIRSIADDGSPSEKWGTPWGAKYRGPPHVVFGHNARAVPQLHPDATGLDTGCVYGGKLTALVLPEGAAIPPPGERERSLVSVPAERAYSDYGRPLASD
ncbi:MAG TPA: metallophosphoesterase [Polyangiaceae bacterium]|nr:metallophosphoesterase [Polyangiaceae bacterium]